MEKMSIGKIRKLKTGDSVEFTAQKELRKYKGDVVKVSKSVIFVKMPGFKMDHITFCRKANVELFKCYDINRFIKDTNGFIV